MDLFSLSLLETLRNTLTLYPWIAWASFTAFVVLLLFIDLKVAHKKDTEVSVRSSLLWSALWISLGLSFGGLVAGLFGSERALEYYSGFLLEKSLSVDNIFVFVMIFSFFRIAPKYQHKVLFYGVLGAIVLRALAILSGSVLLSSFHWMIYVFGGILILTAVKMLWMHGNEGDPKSNRMLLFLNRVLPVAQGEHEGRFFAREKGRVVLTRLALALVAVELSDVIFAVDSIPAIFAVTNDPFIVFSSNVFAILGLRSLFFLSSHLVRKFQYLTQGVAITLVFVGVKMMAIDIYKIPTALSLGIISGILGIAVLLSLLAERRATTNRNAVGAE